MRQSEEAMFPFLMLGALTAHLSSVLWCKDTTMPYVSEKWREIACNGWQ